MELMRINDAANLLHVSPNTLRNWLVAGKFIKPFKLNGVNVWDKADILAWIEQQKEGATHETERSA